MFQIKKLRKFVTINPVLQETLQDDLQAERK